MSAYTEGRETAERALSWVARNPGIFRELMEIARAEYAAGTDRLRRGDVAKVARDRGLVASDDKRFRFDHNLWSALSRAMVLEDPRLAVIVRQRRSALDLVGFDAMWAEFRKAGRL